MNSLMKMGVSYVVSRLQEASSWAAIAASGAAALHIDKADLSAFSHDIAMIGVGLAGLAGILIKEKVN